MINKMDTGKIEKQDKGITLIALVITIIVLLILAMVSIATLTGENGVLTKANTAQKENEIVEAKEQAKLDIATWIADKLEKGEKADLDDSIVKTILSEGENNYVKEAKDTSFTTKKNEYEIPYSELYKSQESEPQGKISFTLTHRKLEKYSGTFEVEKGTTWDEFLSEKFPNDWGGWLKVNKIVYEDGTIEEKGQGDGEYKDIVVAFSEENNSGNAVTLPLYGANGKVVCTNDEIVAR